MTNSCSKEEVILFKLHSLNKEINSKFEGCTGISQKALQQELKQLEANGMVQLIAESRFLDLLMKAINK